MEDAQVETVQGKDLTVHDVLLGRGKNIHNHVGNATYRSFVDKHRWRYLSCSKKDKPIVVREIVKAWRQLDPPGRFLERKVAPKGSEEMTGPKDFDYVEVGQRKAEQKTSQRLRERRGEEVAAFYKFKAANENAMREKAIAKIAARKQWEELKQKNPKGLHQASALPPLQDSRTAMYRPLSQRNMYEMPHPRPSDPSPSATPMVPLTLLMESEKARAEKELEAQVLRNTLSRKALSAEANALLVEAHQRAALGIHSSLVPQKSPIYHNPALVSPESLLARPTLTVSPSLLHPNNRLALAQALLR